MSDWYEQVRRTASLLGGRTPYARHMAEKALRDREGTKDAFFSLYRSYLSPFRAWPDPGWGTGLSNLERAVLVALHHDGWTEQETAYLCGRSRRAVRRAGEKGLRALGTDGTALAGTLRAMTEDLPAVAEREPGRNGAGCGALIICLVAFVLMVAYCSALVAPLGQHGDRAPSVALTFSELNPLRGPMQATIRYAYRVDTPVTGLTEGSYWVVITESDQRLLVEDATPSDLEISPNGRKLAYHSRSKREVVVYDLPSGKISRISKADASDNGLYFSPDGRRLAFTSEDKLYVWDGKRRRVPGLGPESTLYGWLTGGRALLIDDSEGVRAVDLSGTVLFSTEDSDHVGPLPDGKTWIDVGSDENRFTRYGRRTGRRSMRLPTTVRPHRVECWTSADTFVISTYGYGPSHYYRIDIETGEAEPLPALVPEDLKEVRFPGCV
ncbi:PD40 domain-containing protein [Microbispora sp. RL4-1S]|uniref:PD40 domain-containing protein n=1 Tax=Microbispora oryzae TaxID=2806554 RepID=A0A941AKH0_9ACTN|nr:PD40 domain-containing protein [Microbispora oryzae]MBP2707470.1 PD40 domain-containing protein [Microbispora oryzae]